MFTIHRSTEILDSQPMLYKFRDARLCVGWIFSATYHTCALMYNLYPRLTTPRSPRFRSVAYMYFIERTLLPTSLCGKDAVIP